MNYISQNLNVFFQSLNIGSKTIDISLSNVINVYEIDEISVLLESIKRLLIPDSQIISIVGHVSNKDFKKLSYITHEIEHKNIQRNGIAHNLYEIEFIYNKLVRAYTYFVVSKDYGMIKIKLMSYCIISI